MSGLGLWPELNMFVCVCVLGGVGLPPGRARRHLSIHREGMNDPCWVAVLYLPSGEVVSNSKTAQGRPKKQPPPPPPTTRSLHVPA